MPNMNPKKCPMPEQAPDVRNKNFEEVTLGYTAEMAVEEAQRCLNCKNKPCMTGCPVQVKIPEFIALVAEGKFLEAAAKIKETSALPAVCGRVCPQESQCECHCVRGIKGEAVAIGRLERFVADYARENSTEKAVKPESNGHKVAIVGAGPAGLTCAGAYYADAVLWAVKENITKGTTSTTFSPNADCTRAQIVTFLWRCKK